MLNDLHLLQLKHLEIYSLLEKTYFISEQKTSLVLR